MGILVSKILDDDSPKARKRWSWDDLQKPASTSASSNGQLKRKQNDCDSNDEQNKREKTSEIGQINDK